MGPFSFLWDLMATSYIEYPGDGTNRVFSVTFPYLSAEHVSVEIDRVSASFIWLSAGSIQTAEIPAIGSVVRVVRTTPAIQQIAVFSDSATLKSQSLNRSDLQKLYAVQEVEDRRFTDAELALRKNQQKTKFDAQGLPITGIATPVLDSDAANAGYVRERIINAESVEAGQLRSDLESVAAPAIIGFKQLGAGSVSRTLAAKLTDLPMSPEDFGAKGDGVTDDSVAFTAMLIAASAAGLACRAQPNKTYSISAGIYVTDLDIDFDLNGSKFVRPVSAPNAVVFEVFGTLTDRQQVTAVSLVDYTFPGNGASVKVSAIDVLVPYPSSPGDVYKIVADDINPSSDTGELERIGESFEVGAYDPVLNRIYTTNPLIEAYATNIRIVRMSKRKLRLLNLDISDAPGFGARTAALMRVTGYVGAEIRNPYLHDGASYGFVHRSCHRTRTYGLRAERLRTGGSSYGYGIHELGCVSSVHESPQTMLVRHGFTTGTLSTSAGSTLIYNYGASINAFVSNGVGYVGENAPWDTHADSYGTVFSNCQTIGKIPGVGTSYYGFQLRGRNDKALNCRTNGASGVKVISPRTGVYRTQILNHVHEMAEGLSGADPAILINGKAGNTSYCDLDVVVETLSNNALSAANAQVYGRIKHRVKSSGGSGIYWYRLGTASSFDGEITIEMDQATGTNPRVLSFSTAGSVFNLRRLTIFRKTNSGDYYIGDYESNASSIVIDRLDVDVLPNAVGGGFTNVGTGSLRSIRDIVVAGAPRTAGVALLTNSSTTISTYSHCNQVLDVVLSSPRTYTLPSGANKPVGFTIWIFRTANSTGSAATISDGTNTIATLAAAGTKVACVWLGTGWIGV